MFEAFSIAWLMAFLLFWNDQTEQRKEGRSCSVCDFMFENAISAY